jgi:hypothetical protein
MVSKDTMMADPNREELLISERPGSRELKRGRDQGKIHPSKLRVQ